MSKLKAMRIALVCVLLIACVGFLVCVYFNALHGSILYGVMLLYILIVAYPIFTYRKLIDKNVSYDEIVTRITKELDDDNRGEEI